MLWEVHRKNLESGNTIQFNPRGNSMVPLIYSGDRVTVSPIDDFTQLKKGDIVFCKVGRNYYVHKITAISLKKGNLRFQIGNNRGRVNGTIWSKNIFGLVTKVEKLA